MSAPIGPSVWMASDGRAGNEAQIKAIALALIETRKWLQIGHIAGEGHRSDAIELTPKAPWTWLPAAHWPFARKALPLDQSSLFEPPWPTVWIGAGRRTAPYSARMKTWSQGQTFVVHVLNASLPASSVDLQIIPQHDNVSGDNVISTIGSPAYFSPEDIEDAGLTFSDLADEPGKSAVVLLGGQSKSYKFTDKDADRLEAQLGEFTKQGWHLRISASRRTPESVKQRFRSWASRVGARYWDGPSDGPNPYIGWLAYSDLAIITEDSANMLSEACWFNLPIYLARLTGRSDKFDRLHQSFIDHGAARWFTGSIAEPWTYPKLREAERVADKIIEQLVERYPQPRISASEESVVLPDWL